MTRFVTKAPPINSIDSTCRITQGPYHATSYYCLGADTYTHTYIRTEVILRNQAHAGLWPARTWSTNTLRYILMYIYRLSYLTVQNLNMQQAN